MNIRNIDNLGYEFDRKNEYSARKSDILQKCRTRLESPGFFFGRSGGSAQPCAQDYGWLNDEDRKTLREGVRTRLARARLLTGVISGGVVSGIDFLNIQYYM